VAPKLENLPQQLGGNGAAIPEQILDQLRDL